MSDATEKTITDREERVMTAWIKSSFCNGAATCVEVAYEDGAVQVRDSKTADSPVLRVPEGDWLEFVAAVKNRLPRAPGGLVQVAHADVNRWLVWLASDVRVSLAFSDAEMDAFACGVEAGEFDLSALLAGDGSGGDGSPRGSSEPLAAS